MNGEDQKELLEALDANDRGTAIESLLTQAGPNGLEGDLKEMVTTILEKWGMEDFDGAWKWAQSCKPEPLRIFATKNLLENLAGKDPEKALELYHQIRDLGPNYESEVPEIVMKAGAAKGTRPFLELLGRFDYWGSDSTTWGHNRGQGVEFAPDFDFRQVADATMKLIDQHGGELPERFPSNFVYDWGLKDLQAVEEWLAKNPPLPFNEWESLYGAARESLGTQAAGVWMAAKLESAAGDQRSEMLRILVSFSSAEDIKAVAAVMSDAGARDRFLGDLLEAGGGHYAEDNTSAVLEMLSSPAARLEAIGRMARSTPWDPDDEDLQKLGITRAELGGIWPRNE